MCDGSSIMCAYIHGFASDEWYFMAARGSILCMESLLIRGIDYVDNPKHCKHTDPSNPQHNI